MPLNWNEIKTRATSFLKEWENTEREEAEAKEFLIDFLNIFGISRKRVATFEHKVTKLNAADGYIDLLWKGMLLVEMKSKGKDLNKAYTQAKDYCYGLKDHEIPKIIMVCDFDKFQVYDENGNETKFKLVDLVKYIQVFAPIAGYEKRTYKEQDPVNIKAAELMGQLHDKLKVIGYEGHQLELYLVRLLFCLFADDTSIFDNGIFQEYIEVKTNVDGSDLAAHISQIFQILNTPEERRFKNIDEALNAFPYVNGKLFEEALPMASYDSEMRSILIQSCQLDWGKISPAIFGSLFQSVMDEKARRNLGAHYTSEKNILKLIKPLFLDELWNEFNISKTDKRKLKSLHDKISKLRFLDPACGCGNFLIIAYRELRLLELEIVAHELKGQQVTSINDYFLVDVDQFYGIEYEEFPSQIAQVAMWLMDHQMNEQASVEFGEYFKRIPLKKSATIICGNALRLNWAKISNEEMSFNYILGNPPFGGKHLQNKEQKEDVLLVMKKVKNASDLDYVSCWFYKAAEYIQSRETEVAFVSTNSITQGEQVSLLWNALLNDFNVCINFAHRTFKWINEARGIAAVHCVIIGFSLKNKPQKKLYDYENINSEPHEHLVQRINSYLNSGPITIINKRQNPICQVQPIKYGNKPTDDGNYLFNDSEKDAFLKLEPKAEKYFKKYIGSVEFINNIRRWCLWLKDCDPKELKEVPLVLDRIERVRLFRSKSSAIPTVKSSLTPTLFFYISHPNTNYLVIPETSSERRFFIPIDYVDKNVIASNALYLIPNADLYTFGIMCSTMHMTWTRTLCGRLKSDYRYSGSIVYNNFPWPENPTSKQKEAIEIAAQAVIDTRASFSNNSLADLYDPNTMPPSLVKAHQQLDKAVDLCYRSQPFINETKRIEFLFELYDKYTSGLFVKEKKSKKK
jgi:type I restriction-modification system DNA methylase subunit